MRWIRIDRLVEFFEGSHAKAVKVVSLSEDHLHDHFPGFPVMPQSLILEGMAQTGGILLGKVNQFKLVVVLAKVPRMTFHSCAVPGDTLTYTVKLIDSRPEGGMVESQAYVGERLVAEGEIVFAHVDKQIRSDELEQKNVVFCMQLLGVTEASKASEGQSTSS